MTHTQPPLYSAGNSLTPPRQIRGKSDNPSQPSSPSPSIFFPTTTKFNEIHSPRSYLCKAHNATKQPSCIAVCPHRRPSSSRIPPHILPTAAASFISTIIAIITTTNNNNQYLPPRLHNYYNTSQRHPNNPRHNKPLHDLQTNPARRPTPVLTLQHPNGRPPPRVPPLAIPHPPGQIPAGPTEAASGGIIRAHQRGIPHSAGPAAAGAVSPA